MKPRRSTRSRNAAASARRKSSAADGGRRLAAIDIGSNSIHSVVVEAEDGGGFRVLSRERDMVRLGRTAWRDGALSEAAMRNGLEALLKMTTLARLKGARRIVAVATSAVREATNGKEFVSRIRAMTGIETRVLSGEEEAALIFRAVRESVDLGTGTAVLADVGGGSTEWSIARGGRLRRSASVRLGSLRCALSLAGNPPSEEAIARLRRRIRREIARLPVPARVDRFIATSGTAACCVELADFLAGRGKSATIGGLRELKTKDLAVVISRLAPLRRREIVELPPVAGPRAESILAGAVLLEELARKAGVDRIFFSDRALRDGLVLEALGAPEPEPSSRPADVRRRQILRLAERAGSVIGHAQQVARLAVRLFDVTSAVHGLGEREREWLDYASLLHDIGHSIHFRRHHKHSQYLISAATLDAFDPREIEILAHVARYHRGALPRPKKHAEFARLRNWQQRTIESLAALLRIANALDRTHAARVAELYASVQPSRVRVEVLSPYDVSLELSAARHRADLFRQTFDRRIRFRQGLERADRARA